MGRRCCRLLGRRFPLDRGPAWFGRRPPSGRRRTPRRLDLLPDFRGRAVTESADVDGELSDEALEEPLVSADEVVKCCVVGVANRRLERFVVDDGDAGCERSIAAVAEELSGVAREACVVPGVFTVPNAPEGWEPFSVLSLPTKSCVS